MELAESDSLFQFLDILIFKNISNHKWLFGVIIVPHEYLHIIAGQEILLVTRTRYGIY
jgi:hypothetical protein